MHQARQCRCVEDLGCHEEGEVYMQNVFTNVYISNIQIHYLREVTVVLVFRQSARSLTPRRRIRLHQCRLQTVSGSESQKIETKPLQW